MDKRNIGEAPGDEDRDEDEAHADQAARAHARRAQQDREALAARKAARAKAAGGEPADPADAPESGEPRHLRGRAGQAGNPLMTPTAGDKGMDHRMTSITGARKQSEVPVASSDNVVSVRGPDEVKGSEGPPLVTARFNYRDMARAKGARLDLRRAGAIAVRGPSEDRTEPDEEGNSVQYWYLEGDWEVPPDGTPKELMQTLRARKAADVSGPRREGGARKFQLTLQKSSGETETAIYRSREEADAAKTEIERQIRDNPVQGLVARRYRPGQSSVRARGLTRNQYFSERGAQRRKHAQMMQKDPGTARREIARQLGLDDKRADDRRQLDSYIDELKGLVATQARTERELDSLKPDFEGSADGQVHRVTGAAQQWRGKYIDPKTGEERKSSGWKQGKRALEFMWDAREREWVTPVEFSMRRRGQKPVTRQRDDGPDLAAGAAALKAKRDPNRGIEDAPAPGPASKRRVRPDEPAYAEHYMKVIGAVSKYYAQSPMTRAMAEAMQGVLRTTRAKGSPTVQSLSRLSDVLDDLRAEFESRGASLTPTGQDLVKTALDVGYRVLAQPPPTHDIHDEDLPGEYDPQAVAADRGASLGQQGSARMGLARPSNEPRSVPDRPAGREPSRKHVAVAPGLPPKLAARIPYEYRRDAIRTWDDLHDLWGDRDVGNFARLTGAPPNDAAWRALQKKLGTELGDAPEGGVARAFTTGDRPAPGEAGEDRPMAKGPRREPPAGAPWRALSRVAADARPPVPSDARRSGRGPDEPDDEDTLPHSRRFR